jgi:pyruvate-ferredoxin/flavodoxin oxidoreductase
MRAVFYGLGSDGTVGANKNSVRIVGNHTSLHAQGYFVYDSKKSGSQTVSHLRFSPRPIESTYLIDEPTFVACHQFGMLDRVDLLERAVVRDRPCSSTARSRPRSVGPSPPQLGRRSSRPNLRLWVVDAETISREEGLGKRVNTVLQACFFALTDLLPLGEAVEAMKTEIARSTANAAKRRDPSQPRGDRPSTRRPPRGVGARRGTAHDLPLPSRHSRTHPTSSATGHCPAHRRRRRPPPGVGPSRRRDVPDRHDQVREARTGCGDPDLGPGDLHRLRALRVGVSPRRDPSQGLPPHRRRRSPDHFVWKEASGRDLADKYLTVQVAPDDCTGCGVCVDVCPAISKEVASHRAINMTADRRSPRAGTRASTTS